MKILKHDFEEPGGRSTSVRQENNHQDFPPRRVSCPQHLFKRQSSSAPPWPDSFRGPQLLTLGAHSQYTWSSSLGTTDHSAMARLCGALTYRHGTRHLNTHFSGGEGMYLSSAFQRFSKKFRNCCVWLHSKVTLPQSTLRSALSPEKPLGRVFPYRLPLYCPDPLQP